MANGYRIPPEDGLDSLSRILRKGSDRTSEVERPSGSQTAEALKTLKALVDGLIQQTNGNFTGTLTVGGNTVLNSALTVPAAYSNNLTGVGGYRTAYWGINGEAGYVPSSIQFKQDVEAAGVDVDSVLDIDVVRYRYKDAVANHGDDAPLEFGVIAEQVHALGLGWLVEYERGPDGDLKPLGFRYDRLAIGLLSVVQSLDARLRALES